MNSLGYYLSNDTKTRKGFLHHHNKGFSGDCRYLWLQEAHGLIFSTFSPSFSSSLFLFFSFFSSSSSSNFALNLPRIPSRSPLQWGAGGLLPKHISTIFVRRAVFIVPLFFSFFSFLIFFTHTCSAAVAQYALASKTERLNFFILGRRGRLPSLLFFTFAIFYFTLNTIGSGVGGLWLTYNS